MKKMKKRAGESLYPSIEPPVGETALYTLSFLEQILYYDIGRCPQLAITLSNIILEKINGQLSTWQNDFVPYVAKDWGVYLKPLTKLDTIEALCLRVKQLCPGFKPECELYRPSKQVGQIIAAASLQEKKAYVAITCLKAQADFHALNDDTELMQACLNLLEEIKQTLYLSIRAKYLIGSKQKVSFDHNWNIILV